MSWGFVGAAAVSAVGSYVSSRNQGSSSPTVPPWIESRQQDLAGRTDELLERPSMTPEERIAGYDPAQEQAIEGLINYGQEGGVGHGLLQGVQGAAGGAGEGMDALRGIMGEDAIRNEGVNMDYVGSLIDNDVLGDQIQAATRDVERRFSEVDAPQSRLMQALSGGTGSTRGAIGDAILQRGAMDRAGDISAGMRGDAFEQALGLGGEQAFQNANLGATNQALRVGGAGTMISGGLQASALGQNIGLGNINAMMTGGGMNQAYDQALRDVEYQNWQRMYGDVEFASDIYNEMGPMYTGTETSSTQRNSTLPLALETGAAIMGRPGGFGAGADAFDFSEGGFFNSASDYMQPSDFGVDMDWLSGGGGGGGGGSPAYGPNFGAGYTYGGGT